MVVAFEIGAVYAAPHLLGPCAQMATLKNNCYTFCTPPKERILTPATGCDSPINHKAKAYRADIKDFLQKINRYLPG